MHTFSKIIKGMLAITLAAGALWGAQSLAGTPGKKPAEKAPAAKEAPKAEAPKAEAAKAPRVIELAVTERGFEPSPVNVKKGEPLKLVVTRKTDQTCATELIMPDQKIEKALPLNKPVEIAFTPEKSGQIKYGCAMGMMISGMILVE